MPESYESIADLRKAAVFVASLDPSLKNHLLRRLSSAQRARLETEIDALGTIPVHEERSVLREFLRLRQATDTKHAGVELDWQLARKLHTSAAPASGAEAATSQAADRPFHFLNNADPQLLVSYIAGERPQIIAVVLSYLPADKSASVLARLPEHKQVQVIQSLANTDDTDKESLRAVESQLQAWMDQAARRNQRRSAGLQAVETILAAASPGAYRNIVKNLRRHDHHLAGRLRTEEPVVEQEAPRRHLGTPSAPLNNRRFDELADLDESTIARLVAACDSELLVLAMAGAEPFVFERFMARLSEPDAARIRQAIQRLGPTRLSDVEAAQQVLARLAAEIEQNPAGTTEKSSLAVAA